MATTSVMELQAPAPSFLLTNSSRSVDMSPPLLDDLRSAASLRLDGADEESPPATALTVSPRQKWNSSRLNVCRVFTTFYSFAILGMNDGAYGVSAKSTPGAVALFVKGQLAMRSAHCSRMS